MIYRLERSTPDGWETLKTYTDIEIALDELDRLQRENPDADMHITRNGSIVTPKGGQPC